MDKLTKKLRGQQNKEFKEDWIKFKHYTDNKWKLCNKSWNLGNFWEIGNTTVKRNEQIHNNWFNSKKYVQKGKCRWKSKDGGEEGRE